MGHGGQDLHPLNVIEFPSGDKNAFCILGIARLKLHCCSKSCECSSRLPSDRWMARLFKARKLLSWIGWKFESSAEGTPVFSGVAGVPGSSSRKWERWLLLLWAEDSSCFRYEGFTYTCMASSGMLFWAFDKAHISDSCVCFCKYSNMLGPNLILNRGGS